MSAALVAACVVSSQEPRCTWPNCSKPPEHRSVCSQHYQAAKRNGVDLPPPRTPTAYERFEVKVDRSAGPGACHPWTGSTDRDGYGIFKGDAGERAVRYAYRWYVGELAEHELVRHTCDNPPCVNPEHLVSGTPADNSFDMVDRGRSLKGVAHHRALVTEDIVRAIRASYVPRKVTLKALGSQYGLSETAVHAIVTRKTWSHVA